MVGEDTKLNTLFRMKRHLEGMLKGDYPITSDVASYNQAISDVIKMVMDMIHAELDKNIVK